MAIIVSDKYHKLQFTLQTNMSATFTMTYDQTRNGTTTSKNAVVTKEDDKIIFTIPFKNHEINDELSTFVVGVPNPTTLASYGVSILFDGQELETIQATAEDSPVIDENGEYVRSKEANNYFAIELTDNDVHTLQAIYKGTKGIGVATSSVLNISATQNPNQDSEIQGNYLLEIISLPKSMTYMQDIEWVFRLTKGGTGVNGKTIEVDMPHGAVWSHQTNNDPNAFQGEQTDSDGYITIKTPTFTGTGGANNLKNYRKWTVANSPYLIQARFYDYDDQDQPMGVLYKVGQELKIKKGTPDIRFKGAGNKGKKAQFKLVDPQGQNLANKKLIVNIDGKPYNKTTNDNGNVWITINKKGYKTYKVTFAGDGNMKKVTKTFTETVGA